MLVPRGAGVGRPAAARLYTAACDGAGGLSSQRRNAQLEPAVGRLQPRLDHLQRTGDDGSHRSTHTGGERKTDGEQSMSLTMFSLCWQRNSRLFNGTH